MAKKIFLINLLGLLLVPLFAVGHINPFLVTLGCGTFSAYYFFKEAQGYFNTILAWNLGFLLIIGFDGILNYYAIARTVDIYSAQIASMLLNSSYFLINIIYVLVCIKFDTWRKPFSLQQGLHKISEPNIIYTVVIIVLYVSYLYENIPAALNVVTFGRFAFLSSSKFGGLDSNPTILETLIRFLNLYSGIILPALIYHYIKVKDLYNDRFKLVVMLVAPIFIVQLLLATRYKLLLSGGTFMALYYYYNYKNIKSFKYIFLGLVGAFLIGSAISSIRGQGWSSLFSNGDTVEIQYERTEETFQLMTMVTDYYSERDYEYGSSTGAIFLFWIPRSVWPNKPTQMGYWFVRAYPEYDGYISSKYSAPASYMSPVYSDFGVIGVLFQSVLLALLFALIDRNLKSFTNKFTVGKLVLYFLIPLVFFLPRQLSLSFSLFIGVGLLLLVLNIFSKKTQLKNSQIKARAA